MKNHLMYLAYGVQGIRSEALYSILSYMKHNPKDLAQITIYTDIASPFKSVLKAENINYELIDAKRIKKWRGDIDFVHRLKIESIIDFANKNEGNLLFLDSDTLVNDNLEPVFKAIENGELILHDNEGEVSKTNPKTFKFLMRNNFVLNGHKIPEDYIMYNSGAVGFTNNSIHLLKNALKLTDVIYPDFKHFLTEQFSISYFFQQEKIPKTIEQQIYHYWYFKEFRGVLSAFFIKYEGKSVSELITLLDHINPKNLSIPVLEYRNMNFLQKTVQKIKLGKKWKLPDYEL